MNNNRIRWMSVSAVTTAIACAVFASGCTSRAPTIAHVHLGHAITGATDTPNNIGYLVYSERQAQTALTEADSAVSAYPSLERMRSDTQAVNETTNTSDKYPLVVAVRTAADHIKFAAQSADASENLKQGYARIREITEGIIVRSEVIDRYARDAATNGSNGEVQVLTVEIQKLAYANLNGQDVDGDGKIGTTDREYGVLQIRREIDALIARENPPYTTVDRWYLFNLIKLPTGEWMFRRSGGDQSKGY